MWRSPWAPPPVKQVGFAKNERFLMKLKLGILVSCLLIWSGSLLGGVPQLSGSSVTSFLGYQTEHTHGIFYQQVKLMYRPKVLRKMSFHVNLMGMTDLGPQKIETPFQVYGAYLDWKHLWKNRLDFSLGRKFYFNGVGIGYLDGGFLTVRPFRKIHFSLFGGAEVPFNRTPKVYRLQDGSVLGAKLQFNNLWKTRFGVSFYQKTRFGAAAWRLIGVNVSRPFGKSLFGISRVSFNLLESALQKAFLACRWTPSRRALFYLEGFYRTPHIYHDSFFEQFELEGLLQGRLNGVWYFRKKYGLTGDLLWIQSEEKQSQKIRLGILTPYGLVGFQQDLGFAGFQTRGYADVSLRLLKHLTTRLLLDFSNYQISDWEESFLQVGSAFRVEYQLGQRFLVSFEDQFYNNRVYKVDNRILGQALCRF